MKPITIVLMLIPMTIMMIIFGIMACGGDTTPNVYTFPNTHPVKTGSLYGWILNDFPDDTLFTIVESVDTACCIYFNDAKLIRIFDSPDSLGGNGEGE